MNLTLQLLVVQICQHCFKLIQLKKNSMETKWSKKLQDVEKRSWVKLKLTQYWIHNKLRSYGDCWRTLPWCFCMEQKWTWLLHNKGTFHSTQGFPPCRTTPNRLSQWEGFEINKQFRHWFLEVKWGPIHKSTHARWHF